MANKNFNTQTRKMFDNGTEKPKLRTMDPNTKKRIGDSKRKIRKKIPGTYSVDMEKRRQFNKKRELEKKENRREKTGKAKQPIRKPPLKKEPLRKPKDKKMERRTKAIEPVKKPRINKLKDKINKVGDMKVKDAAKVVGKAALATTPIGLVTNAAKSVNKNFKFQSPIVSRKDKKFGGR